MPEPPPLFSVDTHLFRELGELLVGRDSTALLELIKNCYDADATSIVVSAVDLDNSDRGRIVIRDNGCGMDEKRFREGFLRIASRFKETGTRRSDHFQRRYTGSKGIGRLAAHKLAKYMEVSSVRGKPRKQAKEIINATIDWDRIEAKDTLGQLTNEITLRSEELAKPAPSGTTITLSRLRRPWTDKERTRFVAECRSFQAPVALSDPLPATVFGKEILLFETPMIRDTENEDPGCEIKLEGEFGEGDHYWDNLVAVTGWAMEIDCKTDKTIVKYVIVPSKKTKKDFPDAGRREFEHPHPDPKNGPFFQSRILIRDDKINDKNVRDWSQRTSGIRVYLEGFRVLPYGDVGDDWLSLDANVGRRSWERDKLTQTIIDKETDEAGDWELSVLTNRSYTGGVFLTQEDAPTLRMLVNREGFVAEREYDTLVEILKRAIDLATRTRAAAKYPKRQKEKAYKRAEQPQQLLLPVPVTPPSTIPTKPLSEMEPPAAIANATAQAIGSVQEARRLITAGGQDEQVIHQLVMTQSAIAEVITAADRIGDSAAILRVLASLGTQMASFVHEINSLLSTAVAIHEAIGRLRTDKTIASETRTKLQPVYQSTGDLRRQIERQAAYMVEITSTDARRRRSRQPLRERFDVAARLVTPAIERREITLTNDIPQKLKTPAMFSAEVTVVFTNILTNAVKAAGKGGQIRAWGESRLSGRTAVVVENTGVAVDLKDADRWFRAFESTTAEIDSSLGQGMGLGLTITRDLLEQYGATIQFVAPQKGFATAVEIQFSETKENP